MQNADVFLGANALRKKALGITSVVIDATIIAAAQTLGSKILYTEDLTHGQDFDGVRVVNPFLHLNP